MVETYLIYGGLFWNAFIAATLLPAFSELALAALLAEGTADPFLLFAAATSGNVLGSVVNWYLGLHLSRFQNRRWFPFKKASMQKAQQHFSKFGIWSLLFAWLPVIGDPLTLIAGVLKTRLLTFLILVSIGKALRYGLIVVTVMNV